MLKLFTTFLLLCSSLQVVAQGARSLEIFTSPDGVFQFLYPENYELLVGERILRATQGRPHGIPVCDFSTALVCIVYPIESDNGRLEAAGFSVAAVPGMSTEADCSAYADRRAATSGESLRASPVRINGREFLFTAARKTITGHRQSGYTYRTFQRQRCYELRIAVSLSDDAPAQRPPDSSSLGDPDADAARESLKLILGSFFFKE